MKLEALVAIAATMPAIVEIFRAVARYVEGRRTAKPMDADQAAEVVQSFLRRRQMSESIK